MSARPISLILAAGLLLLIGVSGMAAGGGLLGTVANGTPETSDVRTAALAIGTTMAAYGFVAVLAGVALLLLRRWAWRLGIALIVLGLVALGTSLIAAGGDPVLAFGAILWSATLVCLVAPDTRSGARVVRVRPPSRRRIAASGRASRGSRWTWAARPVGVEPEDAPQVRDRAVVDERVAGDADDPDRHRAQGRVGQARLLDGLEDAGCRTRR